MDTTLRKLFAPASQRKSPGVFNPSAVGSSVTSSKDLTRDKQRLHRGKQIEVLCLPKVLKAVPKGPKRTSLKDLGLLNHITLSRQLSEVAIYEKLCKCFPEMLDRKVHPPCIYLHAASPSQLAEAVLPAGMFQWDGEAVLANVAGGALYIVPNHNGASASEVPTTSKSVSPTVVTQPPPTAPPSTVIAQPLPRPPPPAVVSKRSSLVTVVPQVCRKRPPPTQIVSAPQPPPTVAILPPSTVDLTKAFPTLPTVKETLLEQLQSESVELLWKEESDHYSPNRDDDDEMAENWAQV